MDISTARIDKHATTPHVIFSIPEIIDNIMCLATSSSRAQAARVSQHWSSLSLGYIWRDLPSILPLLDLLSPLVTGFNRWGFSTDIDFQDWDRFEQYARRVRNLRHNDSWPLRGTTAEISDETFSVFASRRREGPILPHLRLIRWAANDPKALLQLLPFATATVTTLDIRCGADAPLACATLFRNLPRRFTVLHTFKFYLLGDNTEWLPSLAKFISLQPNLVDVILPRSFSTSKAVIKALAALPSLRQCSIYTANVYCEPHQNASQFEWEKDEFPLLQRLHLDAPVTTVVEAVKKERREKLRDLIIDVRSAYSSDQLRSLVTGLASFCPNLSVISLYLVPPVPSAQITFGSICPLLQLRLTYLWLTSHAPLPVAESDVAEMGRAWPDMTSLSLCRDPLHSSEGQGVTLQALEALLEQIPMLQMLGVYIAKDAVSVTSGSRDAFVNLRSLDFGTSPAFPKTHMLRVQIYLSRICSEAVVISATRTRRHIELIQTSLSNQNTYMKRGEFWNEVRLGVEMIQDEKAQEKAHLIEEIGQLMKVNADLFGQLEEKQVRQQLTDSHDRM
ncbi:hypothetical protein FRB96_008246 [Tulasnella sp. 330]|nr:hypothetical protein FRB96_008246 [Tulasnella sp. 330]KAG8872503.1 hypothetical protein FRB97_007572 [Tulasnella sp. 331]